jgi:hypothetical protein
LRPLENDVIILAKWVEIRAVEITHSLQKQNIPAGTGGEITR